MHEVSVAERMLEITLEAARRNGGGRVRTARLLLGALTCVEPETLRFAFEIACRGTAAEGCRLEILPVAAKLKCQACGGVHEGDLLEPCPRCQSVGFEVLQGRELRIDTIDLEDAPSSEGGAEETSR
ncbi:MAG: hydrogenase maturation nickel metallochaperone HypA [Myxococcales bacterium]|jgi:hydrogenase nickel incorporation protein HypA/HybF